MPQPVPNSSGDERDGGGGGGGGGATDDDGGGGEGEAPTFESPRDCNRYTARRSRQIRNHKMSKKQMGKHIRTHRSIKKNKQPVNTRKETQER